MNDWKLGILVCLITIGGSHLSLFGQDDQPKGKPSIIAGHGSKGFEFMTADSNYLMQVQWRGQFRLAWPTDSDPITLDDFEKDQLILKIRRARMKVGGHAFRPHIKYYLEYELFASNLLDFRLMYERFPFLKFKFGQWKVQYNRERVISSGKQQSLERSLLTRPFTLDRQIGVSLYGRLQGEGLLDFNYWISTFSGTGRGAADNDDENLMWMTRWQWNFTGESLEFSGSDLDYHQKLGAILAVAAVTNRSPYTRFSQAGGGQLSGFDPGAPGQYRINQWMEETAGMFRGFAWQQEFHWKEIKDLVNSRNTTMIGNLIQVGYFFHHLLPAIPRALEIYCRHAVYDPDTDFANDLQEELSVGANWFIKGHENKITAEFSFFDFQAPDEALREGGRFRLQWDVSF